MSALPPFLATLGVDDAQAAQALDERALRRAYARRLKTIDVEAEPERFQSLREALDTALQWIALRERARLAAAPATDTTPHVDAPDAPPPAAGSPPSAEPVAARPAPEEVASAVFAAFHQQVAAVFPDEASARAALTKALSDERLISIDARTTFEWNVARLLAGGWQPGHEHLLDPAVEVFGWNSDHARLANFGQVGALLTAAIRDRVVVQGFSASQRAVLMPLLVRIRNAEAPDPKRLPDEVPQLQFLVERVSNWLRIVSPVDPVNQRFEMWRQMPASAQQQARGPIGPQPQFASKKPASATAPGMLVVLALMILFGVAKIGSLSQGSRSSPSTPQSAATADAASTRDLENRQRRADEMLARILHAPAASAAGRPVPATAHSRIATAPVPAPSSLDQPWYAPEWAKAQDAIETPGAGPSR